MNAIVPATFGALAPQFQNQSQILDNELGAGIALGYPVMSFKGKVWRIKAHGNETPLMRPDGDGPRASIEVVILKAPQVVSKIYYARGYVEGSDDAPDCFSTNGVTPDISAQAKQAASCAACPMNAWGSKVTENGKQAKACADSKRLAIVPLQDLRNEAMGGPMLLRCPAASLSDLAQFGQQMQAYGYPYYGIGIRIAFDPAEAFPKLVFSAIRPLTEAEAATVLEMRESLAVSRVIAETVPVAQPQAAALPAPVFEQPPANAPVIQATAQPVAAPAMPPVQTSPVQVAPVQAAPPPPPVVQVAPPPPPPPPVFPPEGWLPHPQAPGYFYKGMEVMDEAQLRATMAAPVVPPAPPVPPAPVQQAASAAEAAAPRPRRQRNSTTAQPAAQETAAPTVTPAPIQQAAPVAQSAPAAAFDDAGTGTPGDFDAALDAKLNSLFGG